MLVVVVRVGGGRREELEGGWGWLNFSSDHVEPIKADRGTHLHPRPLPLFSFSLYFRPACWPLSIPSRSLLSFFTFLSFPSVLAPSLFPFSFSLSLSLFCNPVPLPTTPHPRHPHTVPPSLLSSSLSFSVSSVRPSSSVRPLVHSSDSLDFFASRGGVIYLAELGTAAEVAEERGCRRWWGEAGRAGRRKEE